MALDFAFFSDLSSDASARPLIRFLESGERFDAAGARRAVGGIAALLRDSGVHAHDRVAVSMTRTPAAAFSVLAALSIGAAIVPLPAKPEPGEFNQKIARAHPKAIVAPEGVLKFAAFPNVIGIDADGAEMKAAIDTGRTFIPRDYESKSEALILFTSGTVGEPKGVVISRRALDASLAHATRLLPSFGPGERFLSMLSWAGGHGLIMTLLAPVFGGAELLVDREFDAFGPVRFYAVLEKDKPTGLSLVPSMLKAIRDFHERAGRPGPGELKTISCASAMLHEDLRAWARAWGVTILNNYGLSETASWVCVDDGFASPDPGGVGFPHVELRIADEAGKEVLPGEVGRVLVRGDQVMTGYLDDPEATRAAFEDGYLDTGDLGRVSEDGRLILAGRSKEIINVGGFKVLPESVEAAALAFAGVKESAAFAIPDDKTGEAVALAVVPERNAKRIDKSALKRDLKTRLPAHAVPKKIIAVDALPRNANGKILRKDLANRFGV